ncbi:MAG: substrate-binding domain-containing protein, partial [Saprospiraceae bacterium]
MFRYSLYIFFVFSFIQTACVKKTSEMSGPTIGTLAIIADESLKDIVQQEEEIFERDYKYAKLNITYMNEYEMFDSFLNDSIDAIVTTRVLRREEMEHFEKLHIYPRQTKFAKGAVAFIANAIQPDTAFTYEALATMLKDETKGKVFIIENAKSGITNYILQLTGTPSLPTHFYALGSKKDVMEYLMKHDNAIGIVDWSDLSDSDNPATKEILKTVHLLGISSPADS